MLIPKLISLAKMEKRRAVVQHSWQVVREIVKKQVAKDISTYYGKRALSQMALPHQNIHQCPLSVNP